MGILRLISQLYINSDILNVLKCPMQSPVRVVSHLITLAVRPSPGQFRATSWLAQSVIDIPDLGFRASETLAHTAMECDGPPGRLRSLLYERNPHVIWLDKIRSLYQNPTQTVD